MGERVRARVFGEVAREYDAARAGYRPALRQAVLDYAGPVRSILESGAGTGKASVLFAALDVPMTCVEPDPAMAAVLAERVAGFPRVRVVTARFEEYRPAQPVDLLFSAQAWHWVDPDRRASLAFAALREGGTFAMFGHSYQLADPRLREAVDDAYRRLAPELMEPLPDRTGSFADWLAGQMGAGRLFTDPAQVVFDDEADYPIGRYLRLLTTFSNHRLLEPDRLAALSREVGALADAHGGSVRVRLGTTLGVLRRMAG